MSWIGSFFSSLGDPKVWRTILVNAAAVGLAAASIIPPPYSLAVIAVANVINHMFNVSTQTKP